MRPVITGRFYHLSLEEGAMSLLHSYSFIKSFIKEVDPRAYLPFGYSASRGSGIDCALEVIDAAKAGKIDLDKVEEAAMSKKGYRHSI